MPHFFLFFNFPLNYSKVFHYEILRGMHFCASKFWLKKKINSSLNDVDTYLEMEVATNKIRFLSNKIHSSE